MFQRYKFKNFIALLITISLLCAVTAQAADFYTPGPIEYELDRTRVISKTAVVQEGNKLKFSAGGSICFDYLKDENGTIKKNGVACLEGCTLGRGFLPLKELLNTIVKENFDGRLSVEISTYNRVSIEMLDESIAFLRAGY